MFFTAPPLVQKKTKKTNADRAREFNNWLKTGLNNIAVFDLLADSVNYLKVEYQHNDTDSHPNKLGNQDATKKFLPFVKNAISQWEATSLKKI